MTQQRTYLVYLYCTEYLREYGRFSFQSAYQPKAIVGWNACNPPWHVAQNLAKLVPQTPNGLVENRLGGDAENSYAVGEGRSPIVGSDHCPSRDVSHYSYAGDGGHDP